MSKNPSKYARQSLDAYITNANVKRAEHRGGSARSCTVFSSYGYSYLSNHFLVSVYNNRTTLCRERNSYLLSNNSQTCCNNPLRSHRPTGSASPVSETGGVICIIRSSLKVLTRDTQRESLVAGSGGAFPNFCILLQLLHDSLSTSNASLKVSLSPFASFSHFRD